MGGGGKKPGGSDGGAQAREDARQKRISLLKADIRSQFFLDEPNPDFKPDFNLGPFFPKGTPTHIGTSNITPEREARFVDIENRTREFFTPKFEQDVSDAQRELNFALSRRGTFGGSAQVDAQSRLQDKVISGEREIGQKVLGARTEAERLDNVLLSNLLDQANQDGDREGIISGARSGQIANTNQAFSNLTRSALENQFTNVGTLFKDINDTAAINRGVQSGGQLAALLGTTNNPFISASSDTKGRIT